MCSIDLLAEHKVGAGGGWKWETKLTKLSRKHGTSRLGDCNLVLYKLQQSLDLKQIFVRDYLDYLLGRKCHMYEND